MLTALRMDVRAKLGIGGNFVGDFVASSFLYPQALLQMELQLAEDDFEEAGKKDEADDTPGPSMVGSLPHKHEHLA